MVTMDNQPADNRLANSEHGAINVRRVDRRLRRDFKRWCMDRNVTMEHAIVQIIDQIVSNRLFPNITPDDTQI